MIAHFWTGEHSAQTYDLSDWWVGDLTLYSIDDNLDWSSKIAASDGDESSLVY